MPQKISNLIIHSENEEEIPNRWGLEKLLKYCPLTIKQKYLTWQYGNTVIKYDLKNINSWVILPGGTGIVFIYHKQILGSENAKIFNPDGTEQLTIINNFKDSKYYKAGQEYYFSKVWRDKKDIWIAVELVVPHEKYGNSYYQYKAKLDVANGTLSTFEPLQEK